MNKFWVMGGASIALSVAAMVWNPGTDRSSKNLLGKAQSEFAMKARSALMQRRMAQASTESAVIAEPKPVALLPFAVASLEPVAPPTSIVRETRLEAVAPEPQTVRMHAPIEMWEPVLPSAPEAAPAVDKTESINLRPEQPQASVSLKPSPAVTLVYALTKAETAIVTSTHASPQRQMRKARSTPPKTNAFVHRSARTAPRYSMPYNLETLRARAPQIAAAIARYM
ncbi:MAG: hypothetical protein H0V72_11725 [Bradyrhizobium sp.]|nr:hypothetical protein [Bradyrhizobium sp.]